MLTKEPLSKILQFAASDIYRNLTILVETLPRMSDFERKTAIVTHMRETRSLIFRLLALAHWSTSSELYIETELVLEKVRNVSESVVQVANLVYGIARVQMPQCSLPLACVVPALDILCSGSYNRLPKCYFDFPKTEPKITDEENSDLTKNNKNVTAHDRKYDQNIDDNEILNNEQNCSAHDQNNTEILDRDKILTAQNQNNEEIFKNDIIGTAHNQKYINDKEIDKYNIVTAQNQNLDKNIYNDKVFIAHTQNNKEIIYNDKIFNAHDHNILSFNNDEHILNNNEISNAQNQNNFNKNNNIKITNAHTQNKSKQNNLSKNIFKTITNILAVYNLNNFTKIIFNDTHFILFIAQTQIKLTSLYDYNGPWKIFDIKIDIRNANELDRTCATKKQIQFLINFVENKMNINNNDRIKNKNRYNNYPFDILFNIVTTFKNKLIFEIIRIQLLNFHNLTNIKTILKKDHISLTFWLDFKPGPHIINFKMINLSNNINNDNSSGIFVEIDTFNDLFTDLSHLTIIDSINLVIDIINTAKYRYFNNIFLKLMDLNDDFKNNIFIKESFLNYDPGLPHGDFGLDFSIENKSGGLIIEGVYISEFLALRGSGLKTDSDILLWLDFFEHYRLFCILKIVKNSAINFKFNWLKINDSKNICNFKKLNDGNKKSFRNINEFTDNFHDENHDLSIIKEQKSLNDCIFSKSHALTFSRLFQKFGRLSLVCSSSTCLTSLILIGANFSKFFDFSNYEMILINPIINKISNDCIKDIQVKQSLDIAEIFDVKLFKEIPLFSKKLNKYDFISCLNIIFERIELTGLLMEFNLNGWDRGNQILINQNVFQTISLTNFFIDRACLTTNKNIFLQFIIDIKLVYNNFQNKFYLHFIFSDYIQSIYKNTATPTRIKFPLNLKSNKPLEKVLDFWSNFIGIFEMGIKIVQNKFFWETINHVKFNIDSIYINYGKSKNYTLKLQLINNHIDIKFPFDLYSSHLGNKNTLKIFERFYHSKPLINKVLFYIIGVTESVSLLMSLNKYCSISDDLNVNKTCPYLTCYQTSTFSFFITYKNTYTVEVNFLNRLRVQLRDGCYSSYWRDKNSNKNVFIPIYFIGKFLSFLCSNFNAQCTTYPPSCFQIDIHIFNDLIIPSVCFTSKDGKIEKYSKLLIFLESCFFLRCVSSFFKLSNYFLIDNSVISFRVGDFFIVMGYSVVERNTPYYIFFSVYAALPTVSRCPSCVIIERYLYSKILSIRFNAVSVAQFCCLFKLNKTFLDNFLVIIRMELDPREDIDWYVEWRHIPNVGQPLKQAPMKKYIIYQGNKYVVMVDFVYRLDPSIYITQLLIWDGDLNTVIDYMIFQCPNLSSKYDEMSNISNEIRTCITNIANKMVVESLPIHRMIQISLKCISQNQDKLITN